MLTRCILKCIIITLFKRKNNRIYDKEGIKYEKICSYGLYSSGYLRYSLDILSSEFFEKAGVIGKDDRR